MVTPLIKKPFGVYSSRFDITNAAFSIEHVQQPEDTCSFGIGCLQVVSEKCPVDLMQELGIDWRCQRS